MVDELDDYLVDEMDTKKAAAKVESKVGVSVQYLAEMLVGWMAVEKENWKAE